MPSLNLFTIIFFFFLLLATTPYKMIKYRVFYTQKIEHILLLSVYIYRLSPVFQYQIPFHIKNMVLFFYFVLTFVYKYIHYKHYLSFHLIPMPMRQLHISKSITPREPSIQHYLNEISRYERLSIEQEVKLGTIIKDPNADALTKANAIEKLVNCNLRFVVSVAKQYQNQ